MCSERNLIHLQLQLWLLSHVHFPYHGATKEQQNIIVLVGDEQYVMSNMIKSYRS